MKGKHILLVNDNKTELGQLAALIKTLGFHQVSLAEGGVGAWVSLKSKKTDCVISAYEMKEMSGLALLRIIRREDGISDTPFFLTDNAFTKIKVLRAGQIGVTGLFVIPYDERRIADKLFLALEHKNEPVIQKAMETMNDGLQFIEKKEYDKALEIFISLVHQKENPEYYFNIGYIKTSQGRHSEAIEAFSMATKVDRLFARAYEEMGRVYKLLGDLAKAEEYMQLAAEIYMDTDKIGAAEEILNEILESGTNSLNVFNTLGVLYRKKGAPEIALSHYHKALKIHPDEPYIYYNMGRLHLDMKEIEKAKEFFKTALKKDPGFEEAKQVIKAIDLGLI